MDKVDWEITRIVRDAEDIRRMKQQPGKDMYAVGGATLVSSLTRIPVVGAVTRFVERLPVVDWIGAIKLHP